MGTSVFLFRAFTKSLKQRIRGHTSSSKSRRIWSLTSIVNWSQANTLPLYPNRGKGCDHTTSNIFGQISKNNNSDNTSATPVIFGGEIVNNKIVLVFRQCTFHAVSPPPLLLGGGGGQLTSSNLTTTCTKRQPLPSLSPRSNSGSLLSLA